MGKTAKIQTNLWFDREAEEAARFYTSVFKNSKIGRVSRYPDSGKDIHGMDAGEVMTVEFTLEGRDFVALNGGPEFRFTEAVSFIVNCETPEELDYYWEKLSSGGDPEGRRCGWLKDKFGVSWQIVPADFAEMTGDPDAAKVKRVMDAMFTMKKLDMDKLREAYKGLS